MNQRRPALIWECPLSGGDGVRRFFRIRFPLARCAFDENVRKLLPLVMEKQSIGCCAFVDEEELRHLNRSHNNIDAGAAQPAELPAAEALMSFLRSSSPHDGREDPNFDVWGGSASPCMRVDTAPL